MCKRVLAFTPQPVSGLISLLCTLSQHSLFLYLKYYAPAGSEDECPLQITQRIAVYSAARNSIRDENIFKKSPYGLLLICAIFNCILFFHSHSSLSPVFNNHGGVYSVLTIFIPGIAISVMSIPVLL